jgi:hypothetical protein
MIGRRQCILDGLSRALGISATNATGIKSDQNAADIPGMISGRRGVKYAGMDVEAMSAIASAASRRHDASPLFDDMAASVSRNVAVTALIIIVAGNVGKGENGMVVAAVAFHTTTSQSGQETQEGAIRGRGDGATKGGGTSGWEALV